MLAAVVPNLSAVAAVILNLFISTVKGTEGVGSEDILIENIVFESKLIPVILTPILLLTTSAV
jgi:hypothetical protein